MSSDPRERRRWDPTRSRPFVRVMDLPHRDAGFGEGWPREVWDGVPHDHPAVLDGEVVVGVIERVQRHGK